MNDPLIESAKEIEALRETVAELTADVSFWNTTFIEAREGYEKELAAMTQERDEWKNSAINGGNAGYLREQLIAAQARIKELREALERCVRSIAASDMAPAFPATMIELNKLLATPDDSSALDAALKADANKWADMAMAHGCTYMVTQIRSLK